MGPLLLDGELPREMGVVELEVLLLLGQRLQLLLVALDLGRDSIGFKTSRKSSPKSNLKRRHVQSVASYLSQGFEDNVLGSSPG